MSQSFGKTVSAMLLISYMLAAALELSIVIWAVRAGESVLIWSYGFLLVSSLISIPVETGESGERIRAEMKAIGLRIEIYDLASNFLRSIVYAAVMLSAVKPMSGALLAYGIAIVSLLLAVRKMK